MKALISILLLSLTYSALACNSAQRAQFDCYERTISLKQKCNNERWHNHVCASQHPSVHVEVIGKTCVVCWDKTLLRSRNGSRRDNSGRVIGKNLSEAEALKYSQEARASGEH